MNRHNPRYVPNCKTTWRMQSSVGLSRCMPVKGRADRKTNRRLCEFSKDAQHDAVLHCMNANNAPTIIPPSYPALESEVYRSLENIHDRVTCAPGYPVPWREPRAPSIGVYSRDSEDYEQECSEGPTASDLALMHPARRAHYNEDGE